MRTYEGGITTEEEPDINGKMVKVKRYRRTKLLSEKMIVLPEDRDIKMELNTELAKDTTRTPIEEQSTLTSEDIR